MTQTEITVGANLVECANLVASNRACKIVQSTAPSTHGTVVVPNEAGHTDSQAPGRARLAIRDYDSGAEALPIRAVGIAELFCIPVVAQTIAV
jgi:hypothetical protein